MNSKINGLVAVGAAAAVNCRPCLEYLVPLCKATGASETDVREAIKTGLRVNHGANAKTRGFVEEVLSDSEAAIESGPCAECCDEETTRHTGCG